MMSFWFVVLAVAGVVVLLFLISWVGVLFHGRKRILKTREYDERQKQTHGEAAKWAFCVGGVAMLAVCSLDLKLPGGVPIDLPTFILLVLHLEAAVLFGYCVIKDAAWPLPFDSKWAAICLAAYGSLRIIKAVTSVDKMRIVPNEDGTRLIVLEFQEVMLQWNESSMIVYFYLLSGILALVLAVLEVIRHFRHKGA